MAVFEEFYKALNKEQKAAVDAIEGPVMVVAGPGTGKTQILTLRIANILRKTDTAPENILAITFTESASLGMRKRLAELIGGRAYQVKVATFHSFCNEIIKQNPENFPRIIGSKNITEVDQIRIIEELIDKLKLNLLRPFGDRFFYAREILRALDDLKQEGVSPEKFSELIMKEKKDFKKVEELTKSELLSTERLLAKNSELSRIYVCYQEIMAERRLYDFSDMILEVLKVLERDKNLLLSLQEEHQYVLVDEHQDTNNAQNRILEVLMGFHRNPNLFVVGDEKQAIFRFQGATLENFRHFKKLYPKARLITLLRNYRSGQRILDSAHALIPGKLESAFGGISRVRLLSFSSIDRESLFLARDIAGKIKQGILPEEIAVLYRDNKDAFPIARALEKEGLPFVIGSEEDVLTRPDVRKLLVLLEAIHRFGEDEYLVPVLHIDFFGLEPLEVYKLTRISNRGKISLLELIRNKMPIFYKKFSGWKIRSQNIPLALFVEELIRASGFLGSILKSKDAPARLEVLNVFFDEIKKFTEAHPEANLADFFRYLETIRAHDLLVKKKGSEFSSDKVRLLTVHRAKGLEFECVYLTGAYDGHFGNRRRPKILSLVPRVYSLSGREVERGNDNDDERRLFYVALTRAKREVMFTYPRENETGRELLPSQFIAEIKGELIEKEDTAKFERSVATRPELIFTAPKEKKGSPYEKKFVRELFEKQGLAVTGLNNYLECPWKYFYINLLRIPKALEKHQMYGIAVHAALHDFFKSLKEKKVGKKFLLNSFKRRLNLEPFTEREYKETLEKGNKALSGYYDKYHKTWDANVLTEYKIDGVMSGNGIRLTGKLDKIEFLDGEVRVVDYKTGKPKTRNYILGKTEQAGAGNYRRQLVFYKLLLDRHEKIKFNMRKGLIDFIEPDEKGRYKREEFEIDDAEVSDLEKLVKKVSGEILNLKFWNRRCDQKNCQHCALRSLMEK